MPGSLTRFGPAKLTGEARSDHTGSHKRFTPAVWMRSEAWPTKPIRIALPSTRAGGRSEWGLGTHSGHFAPRPDNCQRRRSATLRGGAPCGIAEAGAVEVVGHRPLVIAGEQRAGEPDAEHDRRGTGDPRQQVATRWRHRVLHSGLAAARLTA